MFGWTCKKVLTVVKEGEGWNLKGWTPYINRAYVSGCELFQLAYLAKAILDFYCPDCKTKEIDEKDIV
ncbi:MAG: hypothetical protein MRECE_8c052 [Mycoplasmataceae bacterium CE_OT135]|nr:MAG: hypothetical protein MRECE_8c052 [Mycoplasmataceae bacterium CE_OT135]